MKFPQWVETPRNQSKQALASKRLAYLIRRLANEVCQRGSISDLARVCEIDRTTLHNYIQDGAFSAAMAVQIEDRLGRDLIRNEWLRNPLSINTKAPNV